MKKIVLGVSAFCFALFITILSCGGGGGDGTPAPEDDSTLGGSGINEITSFSINNAPGIITGTIILVNLPYGTDPSALIAKFSTNGSSVFIGKSKQVSGTTPNNFTGDLVYKVIAANGDVRKYKVSVNIAKATDKAINYFSINGVPAVISGTTIIITLPNGTNLTSLTPEFSTTGSTVQIGSTIQTSGSTSTSFLSSPVTYTVKDSTGATVTYNVTVAAPSTVAKDITLFSINNVIGRIIGTNITLTLPYGTDRTRLIPVFASSGKSVAVNGTIQTSGSTANDFSSAVSYVVTASDASTKTYTVTVTNAEISDKAITAFSVDGHTGIISGRTIKITVSYLTPISLSDPHVALFNSTGSSTTIGSSEQISGGSFNDFSSPITYTVKAADGTTTTYTVIIGNMYDATSGCFDNIQNGPETDTDCGGSCVKCIPCNASSPCTNGTCSGSGYCRY